MTKKRPRVLVAGAGLGGLCLAQGLCQAGIDVTVLERDDSPDARGQGHRVHIDERGEAALRACLPPPRFELYEATRGQRSERFMLISAEGPQLTEVPAPGPPDGTTMIREGHAVSRSTLREILLSGLADAGRVRFGKKVAGYDDAGGLVRVRFTGGGDESGDLLVGADGIGSAVRRQLLPQAEVNDLGIRWIGGKTPISDEITAALPSGLSTAFAAVAGMKPAMMVGYMRFPPGIGDAARRSGVELTDREDYVMWAIIATPQDLGGGDAPLSGPDLHDRAQRLVSTAHPAMRRIVELGRAEETFYLSIGTSVPVDPWPSGPVTLLGDAIHAMPPSRGSGANTTLADAASLAARLRNAVDRGERLTSAVAGYEADMIGRGFAAVRASTTAIESFARTIVG